MRPLKLSSPLEIEESDDVVNLLPALPSQVLMTSAPDSQLHACDVKELNTTAGKIDGIIPGDVTEAFDAELMAACDLFNDLVQSFDLDADLGDLEA